MLYLLVYDVCHLKLSEVTDEPPYQCSGHEKKHVLAGQLGDSGILPDQQQQALDVQVQCEARHQRQQEDQHSCKTRHLQMQFKYTTICTKSTFKEVSLSNLGTSPPSIAGTK